MGPQGWAADQNHQAEAIHKESVQSFVGVVDHYAALHHHSGHLPGCNHSLDHTCRICRLALWRKVRHPSCQKKCHIRSDYPRSLVTARDVGGEYGTQRSGEAIRWVYNWETGNHEGASEHDLGLRLVVDILEDYRRFGVRGLQ